MISRGSDLRTEAREAYASGHTVFAARFNRKLAKNGGSLPDWSESIESVEAEGWTLTHWAVAGGAVTPEAYPVFRRRE